MNHNQLLKRWAKDFKLDGYEILGKEVVYGKDRRNPMGEIDLIMYKECPTICEVKTGKRGLKKGVEQLVRTKDYFNMDFDAYLLIHDKIYYV